MDRGQPGPPADGSDEAIEPMDSIEAAGAPADDDLSDEPIEAGSPNEVRPLQVAPEHGPPAHWLAYIRAQAPWLLAPGGALAGPGVNAEASVASTGDVVPHGPSAHVTPWPGADPGSGARTAAVEAPAAIGDRSPDPTRARDAARDGG